MKPSLPIKLVWQDLIWFLILMLMLALMLINPRASVYQQANTAYPYPVAFLKFMILAPMGEMLAARIRRGSWHKPTFLMGRALVWGLLGMGIALAFQVFSGGVQAAANQGF